MSNAKYNRDGGTVEIFFDNKNDRVNISIHDEGTEYTAELDRIFDKFYRAAGSERVKARASTLYCSILQRLRAARSRSSNWGPEHLYRHLCC
jgi:signal transduction histidine kinase